MSPTASPIGLLAALLAGCGVREAEDADLLPPQVYLPM